MADYMTGADYSGASLAEELTANFYRWEKRGRGWQVWDYPVEIEPVYDPFRSAFLPLRPAVDDGRKPTFLGGLIEKIWNRITSSRETNEGGSRQFRAPGDAEPESSVLRGTSVIREIRLSPLPDQKVTLDNAERFLWNLKGCSYPVAFEILGTPDSICVQFVCREPDVLHVRRQLSAYLPDLVLYDEGKGLDEVWEEAKPSVIVDFGLSQEFMRPLRTYKNFDPDPLTGVIAALEDLDKDEMGLLQVLLQSVRNPWVEDIVRSVTDWEGRSFFADSPEMVHLAREKAEKPLFAAVVRVAVQSPVTVRAWEIARALSSGLTQFDNPHSNELIPLTNEDYDNFDHEQDVLFRQSHRTGMLLNSQELVAFVHPPSASVRTAKLRRELKKSKAAPGVASGHQLVLGENIHHGKKALVTLSTEQRLRHMHVIGATGTGKSTFLLNLIVQDIKNGLGLGILDPHGDLIDRVLGYIPEERFDDVVLLDPADADYPVGLNILSAYSELDKIVLSSDLVGVFRRLSTSWGDQMNSIFGNAILAFLESKEGGSLAGLRRFLVEKEYRERFLATVTDRDVLYYWREVFPRLTGRLQAPILTRLDTFLRPKLVRNMVAQKEGLNFQEILDGRKIFLAKLAQGLIGVENAYLLGTIIVSKFHQAAMARQAKSAAERENFYLYIDEFQNFVTESMTEILSGARKYHFGLILAHQEMRQLWSRDNELASSVISNAGTRVCFRLGDFDAKKLEDGFSTFDARDLQNLGVGEAICRIERIEYDFNLKTFIPANVKPELARERQEKLIGLCRQRYGRTREEVEMTTATVETKAYPRRVALREMEELVQRPAAVPERKKVEATVPELEGKGGREHKRLQHLIRRAGEEYGYRALVEKQLPDGSGSVDAELERDGKRIACEISVTSTATQELGNIKKCLAAGYDNVILCSGDENLLKKVKELVAREVGETDQNKVLFFQPEEFVVHLQEEAAKSVSKEEWLKGYRVKRQDKPVTAEKRKSITKAMSEVFISSFKRSKRGK
jgi:hypothetical protein